MKKFSLQLLAIGAVLCARLAGGQVEYVDNTMGGMGFMLEPTRPTVSLPNSMVRVYPMRKDGLDDQINSFPLTLISHRLGELFWLMPTDGKLNEWSAPQAYDQEILTPYYLSTRFDNSLIRTEFTPTARCGYFRFTFPAGKPVVLLANRFPGEMTASDKAVSGVEKFNNMQAYLYGEFNAPVQVTKASNVQRGKRAAGGVRADRQNHLLEFRYGISFISAEQAKKNLQEGNPAWDFDAVKRRQGEVERSTWRGGGQGRHGRAKARLLHVALPLLRAHDQHHGGRPVLQLV